MADAFEKYRQSDVSFWGLAAVVCVGIAVLGANLASVLPASVLAGLHSSRLEGGRLNELRSKIASIEQENNRLRFDNARLETVVSLGDLNQDEIKKRVGALESSIPVLLEQLPSGANVDLSAVTSGIGSTNETQMVDGGSVRFSTTPLAPQVPAADVAPSEEMSQPMPGKAIVTPSNEPELVAVVTDGFGVAMGPAVSLQEAYLEWKDLHAKVGTLLIGFEPIISRDASGGFRLVAGPIASIAQAETLCTHVTRAGLQCLPVGYAGYKLPQ